MLKDITFGKYYSTQSLIHDMDGRVNFAGLIAFSVSLLIVNSPLCLVISALLVFTVIKLSNVPVHYVFKSVWAIRFYIVLWILLSFFTDVPKQSLIGCVKMILIVLFGSIFTLTTSINHITDTFEWLLTPLKYLRVPVKDVAVMLSISLRFLPVLADESEHILNAQRARGAKITIRNIFSLVIPVFSSAVKRASDLADAMKAKAYGTFENRTRLYPMKFKKNDAVALVVIAAYMTLLFLVDAYAG